MAVLFLFATGVQFNDPDPIRWVAIYASAAVLSCVTAYTRRVPPAVPMTVSIIAVLWAALIALGGPGAAEYARMFAAWEMKSLAVEEAREASGLLIVTAWMTVLVVRTRRRRSALVQG